LDSTLAFVYFYSIVFPILAGGALYYAVRLTRVAGSFKGWMLMIVFVIVFAIQALSSLMGVMAVFQPDQIEQYVQQRGVGSFISTSSYNVVLASILFAAMFSMYRTFRALQAKVGASRGPITTALSET
jgi:hypothetical protein